LVGRTEYRGGEIELGEFGEETGGFIWERCYPELYALLSSEDVSPKQGGEYSDSARQKIRSAVVHERNRSWENQPVGPEAETELGKEMQRRMGMSGPVADHHVQRVARRLLKSSMERKSKPN
jgi:hypothetical protein